MRAFLQSCDEEVSQGLGLQSQGEVCRVHSPRVLAAEHQEAPWVWIHRDRVGSHPLLRSASPTNSNLLCFSVKKSFVLPGGQMIPYTVKSLFPNSVLCLCYCFWLKWAGYLAVAGLNLLALLALGFTHQKGLSYQIFEQEDSGLPQQGILPISAKKPITISSTDVSLEFF